MKRIVTSSASAEVQRLAHRIKIVVGSWLLIAMIASLSLGFEKAQPTDTPEGARIGEVGDMIFDIHASEPSLKGFKDVEAITSKAFTNRSKEDMEILAGRFYYDQAERARKGWPGSEQVKQKVRKALAQGWSPERYNRAYYDKLLSDTKARMARDPKYRKAINDSTATTLAMTGKNWGTSPTCVVDGWEAPLSWCKKLLDEFIWSFL